MSFFTHAEFSRRTLKAFRKSVSDTFLIPFRQLPRVLFHGGILSCIIAGFWLLDSLKDPVLANLVGIEYQPMAKFFSVLVTLFMTCIYDFLTSVLSKPNLFHLVSAFFGIAMMVISALLSDPVMGLSNHADRGPHRWVGWIAYFMIEVYGSLMVALFWSFTNSIMDLEQAKGAYGLIISIAQVGAIIGSTFATHSTKLGIPQLFLVGAMTIFGVSLAIKVYHLTFRDAATEAQKGRVRSGSEESMSSSYSSSVRSGALLSIKPFSTLQQMQQLSQVQKDQKTMLQQQQQQQQQSPHHQHFFHDLALSSSASSTGATVASKLVGAGDGGDTRGISSTNATTTTTTTPTTTTAKRNLFSGFYEGLSLIIQHRYILQLLGISVLYEIVVTVLDYQFKILGANSVSGHPDSLLDGGLGDGDRFANLLGHFGQVTNLLSFMVSFFGFSFLVHQIGVKSSLMIFPCVLFATVVLTNLVPSLWVLFTCVSLIKALIFSLNDPVKELLYIPTSDAIKFKAKAWIDVFGSRLAKAAGSFITHMARGNAESLRTISEIPCLILSAAILLLAYHIGKEFQRLVDNSIIIGQEGSSLPQHYPVTLLGGPVRNGLRPGDVGYDGYDLGLFDGVFEDDEEEITMVPSRDEVVLDPHTGKPFGVVFVEAPSPPAAAGGGEVADNDDQHFVLPLSASQDLEHDFMQMQEEPVASASPATSTLPKRYTLPFSNHYDLEVEDVRPEASSALPQSLLDDDSFGSFSAPDIVNAKVGSPSLHRK